MNFYPVYQYLFDLCLDPSQVLDRLSSHTLAGALQLLLGFFFYYEECMLTEDAVLSEMTERELLETQDETGHVQVNLPVLLWYYTTHYRNHLMLDDAQDTVFSTFLYPLSNGIN